MALIAVAIRVRMGSPVLFRQVRPGYKGRPFTMLKFRTMVGHDTDEATDTAERVTDSVPSYDEPASMSCRRPGTSSSAT